MKMEKWNRICNSILKHKNQNSKEDIFQTEMEYIFEYVLGWSFNEIITKKRNKVFSANAYAPDIIIQDNENGNDLIVVELKRPNISLEKHRDQLFDYMRLRYSQFGLLIGDKLQFFCEIPINTKPPKLILEIEFIKDSPTGIDFIKLFSKESFSNESIENYVLQKVKEIEEVKSLNELIDFLTSTQGNEYVLQLISNDLKEKHSSKIIEELFSKISIDIKSNKCIEQNIDIINDGIFKPSRITSINNTKEGTKIGQFVQNNMRKVFEQNLLSPEEIQKLQNKEYSKKVFNINYEVLRAKNLNIQDKYGNNRYYNKEIFCGNYYLTSQWVETLHREHFNSWLNKIMKAKTFS